MITLIACARRLAGIRHDEFVAYWRDHHAPLLAGVPEFTRHLTGYSQFHLVAPDSEREDDRHPTWRGFDGIALLSFRTMDAFERAFSEPLFKSVIEPDTQHFADFERSAQHLVAAAATSDGTTTHGAAAIWELAPRGSATPLLDGLREGFGAVRPVRAMAGESLPVEGLPGSVPGTRITMCSFGSERAATTVRRSLADLADVATGEGSTLHVMAREYVVI